MAGISSQTTGKKMRDARDERLGLGFGSIWLRTSNFEGGFRQSGRVLHFGATDQQLETSATIPPAVTDNRR
jgi:hypothetical protein